MTQTLEEVCECHCLDRIPPLLEREERGLEWLEVALQTAVSVEFSTIPPYLTALWSIKDQMHPVAASIRNVVQEEMLHMALACNMLTGIGCVPKINDPHMVPKYPGRIPGGVHPELCVSLAGLSDAALDTFIEIEAPSTGKEKGHKTIGAFYDAIRREFRTIKPELSTERQISGPLAFIVMADLDAVEAGIDIILDQGEGSEASPLVKRTHELAHYYRFLEIRHRRRLSGFAAGQPILEGGPVGFPESWPVAPVPQGGYLQKDVPADVWTLISGIDLRFTQLLGQLQAVWEHGDQSAFVHAIETMFELSEQARRLMSIEIGNGRGNYGPCFRVL